MNTTLNGQSGSQTYKDTPFIIAVEQENNKVYLSTKSYGMSIIVMSDGKDSYMLYPLTKTGVKVSSSSPDLTPDTDINTDDMLLISTGSETFNGKKCQYETYYSDGTTTTAYFYNNKLIGMVMQSDETDKSSSDYANIVMIINELSTDIDESLFTVPSDYKITESDGNTLL